MKRGSLIPRRSMTVFCEGAKGTMSEAELFVLRARLQGGILNKARRGALKLVLPMGLCYTESDTVVLDPNVQVQATIGEVFHRFEHTGSAFTTVRHFHQEHLLFPRRGRCGPHQGGIMWGEMSTMMCGGGCTTPPIQEPTAFGGHRPRKTPMARCKFLF